MADDEKSPSKSGDQLFYRYLIEIFAIVVAVFILRKWYNIAKLAISERGYVTDSSSLNILLRDIYYTFVSVLVYFTTISNIFSSLLLMVIIYSAVRLMEVTRERNNKLVEAYEMAHEAEAAEQEGSKEWQRILTHVHSPNPSDWRLAILEADIILDEILDKMGYVGNSVGEKLKKADRADFRTIDSAWEAHKIRNQIAHEGADFVINERDAERVIALYKEVFDEFHYL